jgi:hypothetical protein
MKQVGHADSKMMLEVYQLQQRVKREHGASFDRLIREAREAHGPLLRVQTSESWREDRITNALRESIH